MAKALPLIQAGAMVIGSGVSAYNAFRGSQGPEFVQPVNVGSKQPVMSPQSPFSMPILGSTLSNPYLSTRYYTSSGQLRGK